MDVNSLAKSIFNAVYEELLEQNMLAEVLVDTTYPGVVIPKHLYVGAGEAPVLLNLSPNAVGRMREEDTGLRVNMRFNRVDTEVFIPWFAMVAMATRTLSPPALIQLPLFHQMALMNNKKEIDAPVAVPKDATISRVPTEEPSKPSVKPPVTVTEGSNVVQADFSARRKK